MLLTGAAASAALAFVPTVTAQRPPSPLNRELRRQLKAAIGKINNGKGEGARQAASVVRMWAASLNGMDFDLRPVIKQKGRNFLLYTATNHAEMQKLAEELGFPLQLLPPHAAPDPNRRERALRTILAEGFFPTIERAAQELEAKGEELDRRGASIRSISLLARACELPCDAAESTGDAMQLYCAAMFLFPALAPACELASGSWLALLAACYGCRLAACGSVGESC
jgi:hypothetical protein